MFILQATKISCVISSYPVVSRYLLKWVFWHIKESDVDHENPWATKTLTRTCQIRYVASCSKRDPTKLTIMDLSCFCAFCIDEDYQRCMSLHHARDWRVHFIVPLNPTYIYNVVEGVNEKNDWEHGGNGEEIVQSLKIGDNFSMNATPGNEVNCQFYIVSCEKSFFEVDVEGLSDNSGNTFEP
jgi:hypothetical protein